MSIIHVSSDSDLYRNALCGNREVDLELMSMRSKTLENWCVREERYQLRMPHVRDEYFIREATGYRLQVQIGPLIPGESSGLCALWEVVEHYAPPEKAAWFNKFVVEPQTIIAFMRGVAMGKRCAKIAYRGTY